jgi:hypothetical protein
MSPSLPPPLNYFDGFFNSWQHPVCHAKDLLLTSFIERVSIANLRWNLENVSSGVHDKIKEYLSVSSMDVVKGD